MKKLIAAALVGTMVLTMAGCKARLQKQQEAKLLLMQQAAHWLWLPMQSSRHMNIMKAKMS